MVNHLDPTATRTEIGLPIANTPETALGKKKKHCRSTPSGDRKLNWSVYELSVKGDCDLKKETQSPTPNTAS